MGEAALNTRKFTVECMAQGEYLTLSFGVLDRMKKNFQAPSRRFMKQMISQFKLLLTYSCFCVAKFQARQKNPRKKAKDFLRAKQPQNYIRESATRLSKFTSNWNLAVHEQPDRMSDIHWTSSENDTKKGKKKTEPRVSTHSSLPVRSKSLTEHMRSAFTNMVTQKARRMSVF